MDDVLTMLQVMLMIQIMLVVAVTLLMVVTSRHKSQIEGLSALIIEKAERQERINKAQDAVNLAVGVVLKAMDLSEPAAQPPAKPADEVELGGDPQGDIPTTILHPDELPGYDITTERDLKSLRDGDEGWVDASRFFYVGDMLLLTTDGTMVFSERETLIGVSIRKVGDAVRIRSWPYGVRVTRRRMRCDLALGTVVTNPESVTPVGRDEPTFSGLNA